MNSLLTVIINALGYISCRPRDRTCPQAVSRNLSICVPGSEITDNASVRATGESCPELCAQHTAEVEDLFVCFRAGVARPHGFAFV